MRTDSTAIAGVAMGEAREVIGRALRRRRTRAQGRVYKTKSKGAQEAHEAIRPTSFRRDPDSLERVPQARRAAPVPPDLAAGVASQMAPTELETTDDRRSRPAATSLRACGDARSCFAGFRAVYTEGRDDGADEDEETAGCRRSRSATDRRSTT